jgi:HSP20 family molecular chaperone IbpA
MANTAALEKRRDQAVSEKENTTERRAYAPHTDIYEREDALVLVADMPGVSEKDVDIDLEDGVLTISGRVEGLEVDGRALLAEYDVGDYNRSFTLSNEIDTEGIEATMKDGVLRLVLPKSAEARPKKIEVKGV